LNLSRRQVVRSLAGGALGGILARGQTRRPNLLILLADDMGWGDATFNGRRDWEMPNLDRLAGQGTVFNRWYTASPLCAPSRACLLTGRYTIHHGVRNNSTDLPANETTLAEAVKPLGYRTALFGKWHRGVRPDGGFTHPSRSQDFVNARTVVLVPVAARIMPPSILTGKIIEPYDGRSEDAT